MFRLIVPGKPVHWSRAAKGRFGNVYNKDDHRNHAAIVKGLSMQEMEGTTIYAGALVAFVAVFTHAPKNLLNTKKKLAAMAAGNVYPLAKPDSDNYYKLVADALSGVVYRDDAIIVDHICRKRYVEGANCSVVKGECTCILIATVDELQHVSDWTSAADERTLSEMFSAANKLLEGGIE